MKIAYCEHPVTKAQKEELRNSGFKIVDIAFKPKELAKGDKVIEKPKAKAKG